MTGEKAATGDLELLPSRHLALRTERMKAITKIQSEIRSAARGWLLTQGFLEITPPLLAQLTDPGLRGAKIFTLDFYGRKYKLTSSMMFHKIVAASSMGKIFSFSPCLRSEPLASVDTGRHLAEFWQIEVEMHHADYRQAMAVAEKLVSHICSCVRSACPTELSYLGRELGKHPAPFKKITHSEAVKLAKKFEPGISSSEEIPWDAERQLSQQFSLPFFITRYPTGSRGLYDRTDPLKPGELLDFDLIYPGGFGEAASGGEREFEHEKVLEKIRACGEKPGDYAWFLDAIRQHDCHTAGFGIGLERLTRYVCGLEKVWEATQFPKVAGIFSP